MPTPLSTTTAQAALSKEDALVVTFSPTIAGKLSSIRLLLPGDPVFENLLSLLQRESTVEESPVLSVFTGDPQTRTIMETAPPIPEDEVVIPIVDQSNIEAIDFHLYSDRQRLQRLLQSYFEEVE